MKTIKEFFYNHPLKDKYDLELPQFTAEDIESYARYVLLSLEKECEEMSIKEKDPTGVDFMGDSLIRFRTIYAVSKQVIIDKINNIWQYK